MSRQECSDCKVQTTEFGCKNCGSTRLHSVPVMIAGPGTQPSLLETAHAVRARSDMITR